MATELGQAYITIMPSMQGFGKTVNNTLNDIGSSSGTTFGKNFSSSFSKALSSIGNVAGGALNGVTQGIGAITAGLAGISMSGGITRALNLEQAQHLFNGLGLGWETLTEKINASSGAAMSYKDIVNDAVEGTQFSLDEAAIVAANLGAAGITSGEAMSKSLYAATGTASTFGANLADVGDVFQRVAAAGKLSAMNINQLTARGIPVLSTLSSYLGKTQAEVQDMVSHSEIDFQTFSDAMYEAFGENAKSANDTFTGSLANVKSALSRLGAKFATPGLEALKNLFNALRPLINAVSSALDPLVTKFTTFLNGADGTSGAVSKLTSLFESLTQKIQGLDGGFTGLSTGAKLAAGAFGVLSAGGLFSLIGNIPIVGQLFGGLSGVLGKALSPTNLLTKAFSLLKSPLGIIGAVIGIVVAAFKKCYEASEPLRAAVSNLASTFSDTLSPIVQSIGAAFSTFQETLKSVFSTLASNSMEPLTNFFISIVNGLSGAISFLPAIASEISTFLSPVVSFLQTTGMQILGFFQEIGSGIQSAFSHLTVANEPLNGLVSGLETVNTPLSAFASAFSTILTNLSPVLPLLQTCADVISNVFGSTLSTLAPLISSIFDQLGMTLQGILPMISDILTNVSSAIGTIAENVAPVLETIGNAIATTLPIIVSLIEPILPVINQIITVIFQVVDVVSGFINDVIGMVAPILPVIAGVIDGIVGAIQNVLAALQPIVEAIMPIVSAIIDLVVPAVQIVINIVKTVISVIMAIASVVIPIIGAILTVVINVISGIISFVTPIISFIAGIISAIIGFIGQVLNAIANIGDTVTDFGNLVLSIGTFIVNAVLGFVDSVIGFFVGLATNIIDTVVNIWTNVTTTFSDGVAKVLDFVGSIPDKILEFFANAGTWLIEAGKNIIGGFFDGIKGAIGGVFDFFGGIGETIASLKGPEKYDKALLIPAGTWIIQGLLKGLQSNIDSVYGFVGGIGNSISDNLSTDIQTRFAYESALASNANRYYLDETNYENSLKNWLANNLGSIIATNAPNLVIDNEAGAMIVDSRLSDYARRAAMNRG